MSYRQEEKKIQWKLRRIRAIAVAVLFFVLIGVGIFSAIVPPKTWRYYFRLPSVSARATGELRIHALDVGQGDCTLIELPDGKTMLIDGGDGQKEHTTAIFRYLNALKIKRLDYVVLTHTDEDHCGGLDEIVKRKKVGTVYYPTDENVSVNEEYASFFDSLSNKKCEKELNRRLLKIGSVETDGYQVVWLWPYSKDNPGSENLTGNQLSAVLWVDYGDNEALLMGDATTKAEEKLIDATHAMLLPQVDITSVEVLKVSHHGSQDSTSVPFLQHVNPKYALISCGSGNPYGHPDPMLLSRLEDTQSLQEVYRTDEKGNVIFSFMADGSDKVQTIQ